VQFATGTLCAQTAVKSHYQPQLKGDMDAIVRRSEPSKATVFYTGGGVISGPAANCCASSSRRRVSDAANKLGLGCLSGIGRQMKLGMLWDAHGTYRANVTVRRLLVIGALRWPHHRRGRQIQSAH
jgi:acetolactate synthase-1/2/3 large subunit